MAFSKSRIFMQQINKAKQCIYGSSSFKFNPTIKTIKKPVSNSFLPTQKNEGNSKM
jgi:hypothetical protein